MTIAQNLDERLGKFTAQDILAIDANEPERLFTGDQAALKAEFKALSKLWHPDLNKMKLDANIVFVQINALHEKAKEKLKAGLWTIPGILELTASDGHVYRLKYRKKHSFELGTFYISENFATFIIDNTLGRDLAVNGLQALSKVRFADDKLRKEFENKTPSLIKSFETATATVCVFKKDPEMVLLADLRDYILQTTGKNLDPKHVAWIMSRLHSFACFLKTNGLTHNAISADTLFVSPSMHTAALIGGWWYAAKENTRLKGLPGSAIDKIPSVVLTSGKATPRTAFSNLHCEPGHSLPRLA